MKLLLLGVCCLFTLTGCMSHRVIENTRTPEIELTEFGNIEVNGEPVEIQNLLRTVRGAGFGLDQEVNVLIPENPDRRLMQRVTGILVQGGYRRTIFVTKKKAFSDATSQPKFQRGAPPSRQKK